MRTAIVSIVLLVAQGLAAAAPGPVLASTERPVPTTSTHPAPTMATFGLCSAPQNADDFASRPVPVQHGQCEDYQEFQATSAQPSNGAQCGGYTVAFGPLGDLKRTWKRYQLKASWGDAPLTAANCATAHLAAAAWGYRCDNTACTAGAWERIEPARSRAGSWNSVSQVCYIELGFVKSNKVYKTLNIDVIATQGSGASAVRKRAKGWIYAGKGNGGCASASAPN